MTELALNILSIVMAVIIIAFQEMFDYEPFLYNVQKTINYLEGQLITVVTLPATAKVVADL